MFELCRILENSRKGEEDNKDRQTKIKQQFCSQRSLQLVIETKVKTCF